MKVLTIGGAIQDIFLCFSQPDIMKLIQKEIQTNYLLFESGEKIDVEGLFYHTGGGATNSAVSFRRLGFEVACFCIVGDDHRGAHIFQDLEQEGIDISSVIVSSRHATGISFIVHCKSRDETIFVYRGANSFLPLDCVPYSMIEKANQLYITSLSNQSAYLLRPIVKYAKQKGIPVTVNPGSSQLSKGAHVLKDSLADVDMLILNACEAKMFMIALIESDEAYKRAFESKRRFRDYCPGENLDHDPILLQQPILYEDYFFSVRKFFREVFKMGPQVVIITNGANGVYLATGKKILFHPSLDVEVVDTVGAGDSFGSCFTALRALGYSVEDALRGGIINSASVIGKVSAKAGMLTEAEIKKRLKKVQPTLLQRFSLD